MKSKQSKTSESQAKYGTMTALEDSNNDYSASSASSSAPSSTSASMRQYGTMTALEDSNGDYGKKASSSNQDRASNRSKQNTLTASYDANQQP